MRGGRGQVLVFEAVAQHRMIVVQVENHRDPRPALDVLKHDELPDAAWIDALGVLVNQEELRLGIERVAIGLYSDRRGRPACGRGPLVAGLEIGNPLGEKEAFRRQLKRRADPTVGEGPGALLRIEIRLRSAKCQPSQHRDIEYNSRQSHNLS